MAAVTIITGCPGSGKTTLAAMLARRSSVGVHIVSDEFYRFLAHRIDPSTPESKSQNTAVVRAFLAAARSFSEGGFEVFVDGVIGPWWREEIQKAFDVCEIVCLHADLETVLGRADARAVTQQASASRELVCEMHRQFGRSSEFESRTIDTAQKSIDQVVAEFDERSTCGDFSFA